MRVCPLKKMKTLQYDSEGKISCEVETFEKCDKECVMFDSSQVIPKSCLLASFLKTNILRNN